MLHPQLVHEHLELILHHLQHNGEESYDLSFIFDDGAKDNILELALYRTSTFRILDHTLKITSVVENILYTEIIDLKHVMAIQSI